MSNVGVLTMYTRGVTVGWYVEHRNASFAILVAASVGSLAR